MKKVFLFINIVFIIIIGLFFFSCDTGVEDSPQPGIVRITLKADQSDTTIIIINDTLHVSAKDKFDLTIFQGKVYNDSNFAILFRDTKSYRQVDVTDNILTIQNGKYKEFVIYESYVPPIKYNKIEFGVTASQLNIGNFEIPVQLQPGDKLLIPFDVDFSVSENKTTQIDVEISPFKSVKRYKDSYYFLRIMKVTGVHYQ